MNKTLLSCRILCCFTAFEAILKRFQRVSAGGGAPLKKKHKTGAWLTESNHRTAKAEIFPRNGRSCFKSRSAEAWITRFPVRRSLVYKSHRNGLKIPRLPAQICLSCCCVMRIAKGCDTKFENQSLETASARQNHTRLGWEGTIAYPSKIALTTLHDFCGSWHLYICRSLLGHSTSMSLRVT